MSYYKRFDAKKYWANKPYCSICGERKVKTGNICYKCQKEGGYPSKSVDNPQTSPLDEDELLKVFTTEDIDRNPAESKIKSISGYLKDCALATLRSYKLIDITDSKDVDFLPLDKIIFSEIDEQGILLSNEKAFNLAYKAAARPKELDLLLGTLFITGRKTKKNGKKDKFLAPLVYIKMEAERTKEGVHFTVSDDSVELNQALLSKLVDSMEEDELEVRLQDIYGSLITWPFSKIEVKEFVKLTRNAFPNAFHFSEDEFAIYSNLNDIELSEEIRVFFSNALILAPKKEAEGTVVNELLKLSTNLLNQTAVDTLYGSELSVIEEESTGQTNYQPELEEAWTNLNPLDLSETKQEILHSVRKNNLTVITGPPGTGKSYTIMGIILDHLLAGKRVLFVSKMDKAVDVVVNNLEEKIGPYSVARSGNRKAQKALAKKIEKLTGSKTSSPVKKVTQNEVDAIKADYKAIEYKLHNLKKDFERVVSQEKNWGGLDLELKKINAKLKNLSFASNQELDVEDAKKLKNKVKRSNALVKNEGFFLKTWWGKQSLTRIKNQLGISETAAIEEVLTSIDSIHIQTLMKEIEKELAKFERANQIWSKISTLQKAVHQKAQKLVNLILLGNLYVILNHHKKRLQLRNLRSALLTANLPKKQELLSKVDAETLITAFPFWASTTNHLSQILPLEPGLFDLVIFDEASQCDLASALPALYRANRAVVVGDPQQLRHVVIMSKQIEQAAMVNNDMATEEKLLYKFTERSLFDVAMDKVEQGSSFMLNEHFRSDPRIISFSSEHFYDGKLRIMTSHPVKQISQKAIEIRYVDGRRNKNSTENPSEINAIFTELRNIINNDNLNDNPTSIGILCPFRDQVNAIISQLPKYISLEEMEKHEIVVGTAHSLQGDEKDIVLLSLSIDPNYHHGSLRFLEKPNVFNVAITRAKEKLIVFSSVRISDLPHGLLKDFLVYAEKSIEDVIPEDVYDSKFEREVADALRNAGLQVWPQFEAAGFKIDLVVGNDDRYIAVECDGPSHFDAEERIPYKDSWRQGILERAGWEFVRIPYRDWNNDKQACIETVMESIEDNS